MNHLNLQISFNSPVVLIFVFACAGTLVLNTVTGGWSNHHLFSVYRSSLGDLFSYVRVVGHVFGHANFAHFFNNITLILLVGPLLEEKYGGTNLIFVILLTALVTGVCNVVFFPNVALLGASGIVFAFILLSSMASFSDGKIPLTFILVAVIYIGREVVSSFSADNISQFTHIVGGIVGAGCGYFLGKS